MEYCVAIKKNVLIQKDLQIVVSDEEDSVYVCVYFTWVGMEA